MKLPQLLKTAAERLDQADATIRANAATISSLQAKVAALEAQSSTAKTASTKDDARLLSLAKTAAESLIRSKLLLPQHREAKIAELLDPARVLNDLAKTAAFVAAPRLGYADNTVAATPAQDAESVYAERVQSVLATLPR